MFNKLKEQLPQEYNILYLLYKEKLTVNQIANKLNLTVSQARNQIFHAKIIFRNLLKQKEII